MNRAFRILLIEDSETQAFKLRCLLEEQDWHVSVAASAEAALAVLAGFVADDHPDLILVDYNLPGMRGDEFCRRIRMKLSTRGLPVLIMTASAPDTAEIQCLESGADDYVFKSGNPEILLLRVRALLRKSEAQPALSNPRDSDFRPARILVIDDSPTYLAFLSTELGSQGYEVKVEVTGMGGLGLLPGGGFDCILVDLVMPEMDGIEVCRRIAAMDKSLINNAAVIMITGSDNQVDLKRGLESGADDFVGKSRDLGVLRARIQALMRRRFFQEENGRMSETPPETPARSIRNQRAVSLGLLMAGIARKIDNPLARATDNLFVVERGLDGLRTEMESHLTEDSLGALRDAQVRLLDVRQSLGRAQELVLDLRTFSRLDEVVKATADAPGL